MFDIPSELEKLPARSGVYLMRDETRRIIYVGKAKSLRNRVRSYFRENVTDYKTRALRAQIAEFEYILTDTELEAFILENNLIKKYKPKYNILLKDSKTYPYIKITTSEPFPRVLTARRRGREKARYFGPFVTGLRDAMSVVRSIWPVRLCDLTIPPGGGSFRPCLNNHIGRCGAPCAGLISAEDYREVIEDVARFLSGQYKPVLSRLEREMAEHAENMRFEQAAKTRDAIRAINRIYQEQKIDDLTMNNRDIIGFARDEESGGALFFMFFLRDGKIVGSEDFLTTGGLRESDGAALSAFIRQFYNETTFLPKEIVTTTPPDDLELLEKYLWSVSGANVSVKSPSRGEHSRLAELASRNAAARLSKFGAKIKRDFAATQGALEEIRALIGLERPLARIEAYDISNTSGADSVASMIVFAEGRPKQSDYRKFRIKTVSGPDDYASVSEVIRRRFERFLSGDDRFNLLPDAIFIDGGKGQVSAVLEALSALRLEIPVCGMVKDDAHRTRGLFYGGAEYSPNRRGEGFKLITRIQDETHRFALEYHKKLRSGTMLRSVLDEIPGVGETRRRRLLQAFGSLGGIKAASFDQLRAVPGMNASAAKSIRDYFEARPNELEENKCTDTDKL
ncbi:MAG: excinuclease ABC subunit UvrC [Clostridiales bacterium]|jgi:excinuclease ABC subunit C|nr:excinuclease ABC subunit UvrC [Clostridiales bacterium]